LKTAIDVVDASADFLAKTKRVIGVPFVFFFLSIISVLVWSGSFAAVISMNHIEVN
jgi:Na+-transporting methylmalonyl-CoA/oxaloacetate decarboxylase gamma subunit